MKARSIISVFALFIITLLWSCGGSHDARIVAVLDRADSLLLTSDPALHDSVRQELEALDTARALQSDEMLRARHALLLVQARYKCYATIPADSALIDTAYRYYADHHSSSADHERYTRTLIYQGAVAKELGHPQQAIQWYLKAEQVAAPNDYSTLGYINLRIAGIYQAEYSTDSTALIRNKQALLHYRKAGDIYWQAVCLTSIGGQYRLHNNDSALLYLQQATDFSKEHGLTYNYYKALDDLCGLYYLTNEFEKAKDVATQIYRENQGAYNGSQYLSFGGMSFAKLGMTDSAEYYLHQLPTPQSKVDSVEWLDAYAEVYRAKGDYQNYSTFAFKSDSIADELMLNSYQLQLKDTEEKCNNTVLKLNNSKLKFNQFLFIFISLLLLLLLLLLLQRYHNTKRQIKLAYSEKNLIQSEMQRLALEQEVTKMSLEKLEKENDQLAMDNKHLTTDKERLEIEREKALTKATLRIENNKDNVNTPELLACHHAVLRELTEKLKCNDECISFLNAIFTTRKRFNLRIGKLSNDFWNNVEKVANLGFNGIISYFRENYPNCSENDLRFIGLSCLKLSNEVMRLCLNLTNIKTVSSYKTYVLKNITGKNQNIDEFINNFIHNNQKIHNL